MPVPFPPLTFRCLTCGWKRTTHSPVSDVRFPGINHFSSCPRCRGEVEMRRAHWLEVALVQIAEALRRC